MELIERYIHEVGRHLPKKQRADVQQELRSLLEDMVEDQAQTKLEHADEATAVAVLQQFGHPKKVAASYNATPQYLVGPTLYPVFQLVLSIVGICFAVVILLGLGFSLQNADNFLGALLQSIAQTLPNALQWFFSAFGSVAFVFALIERFLPADQLDVQEEEAWDPRKLPSPNLAQELNRGDVVTSLASTVILLWILNVTPHWIMIYLFNDDVSSSIPILADNFFAHLLPWVNLLLIVSLGVDIYKLRQGWHGRTTRLLDIAVTLLTAVVVYLCITRGPLFHIPTDGTLPSDLQPILTSIFNGLEQVGLPILFLVQLLTVGKQTYDLWRTNQTEPTPILSKGTG